MKRLQILLFSILCLTITQFAQPLKYQTDAVVFGKNNNINLYNLNTKKSHFNLLPVGPTANQLTSYGEYFFSSKLRKFWKRK